MEEGTHFGTRNGKGYILDTPVSIEIFHAFYSSFLIFLLSDFGKEFLFDDVLVIVSSSNNKVYREFMGRLVGKYRPTYIYFSVFPCAIYIGK